MKKKFLKYIIDNDYRFLINAKLGLYDRLDDEEYIKRKYKARIGKELDLKAPKTFNEKLQWLKLYDRKDYYFMLVDKSLVKDYIANIIGEEYIIPTLGVWNTFDEIDFSKLPNQFVLKCTHDSGGLVICRDKSEFDKKSVRGTINASLKHNFYFVGREWPYKNVKPRVLAEMLMEDDTREFEGPAGLSDYKFFCFNGVPKLLYISKGLEHHATARISFYDLCGNEMPFRRSDYKPLGKTTLPDNFSEMIKVAKELAEEVNSDFVRIDLYSINRKIYFSEITFSPCSGLIPFEPMEWDEKLGEWLELKSLEI